MQKNVLEYLENSARYYPEKIAYGDDSGSISFGALLKCAKAIGTKIASSYDKTSTPIGVLTGRNYHCLAAFFGVLYSGNFYVPIDTKMPKARLDAILEKLSPELILNYEGESIEAECTKMEYTLSNSEIDEKLLECRRNEVLDIDPVYAIYTSGSTGVPKGIVISHRSVIDFIDWMAETLEYTHDDIFANQAPFYFDCSVKDLYLTLKLGATDYIIPQKYFMFPTLLIDFLNEKKISSLTWATSGFNLVSSSKVLDKKVPQYIRKVAIGGEAMLAKHLNNWRRVLPNAQFINLYGPTEVTVDCTYHIIEREYADSEAIPIGKACQNKQVMLLDNNLKPVKKGESGEICVRGSGLARGYYNEPEKTNAAFVQNPERPYIDYIYRTGDIGILNENNEIVFQARLDGQIKHMGYRIELGEIERALNSLSEISSAICFFDKERDRIVCVCVTNLEAKDIAGKLSSLIPKYMLPNIYRKLSEMPYNANGKIDRVKLRGDYDNEANS